MAIITVHTIYSVMRGKTPKSPTLVSFYHEDTPVSLTPAQWELASKLLCELIDKDVDSWNNLPFEVKLQQIKKIKKTVLALEKV